MPRKDNTNDTHSSYSPQDRPLQAPTRSRVNDHSEHQIGDVNIDDTLGGGYATFENCEENEGQGKGKLPLPKGRKDWRPSITEQRKSSLVSRVETAGKDAFRRSSTYLPSEKSAIDALADTFNTWSPGVDRPKAAVESERRVSWSERAMSFLFNREKPSLKQSAAGYQPAEDGGQHDVEYLASDGAYDDLQGTFYVWKDRPDTVTTNSAATKSQSLSSYADIVKQGLKRTNNNNGGTKADTGDQQKEWFDPDPEKARVAVPPRSVPKGNDQELWFDSDPESGRVALPPLSVNASKEQKNDKQQSSKLLHSLKGQKASTQAQDSLNEDQDFNIREKKLDWRTKATENYEDTQKTNKYDSDLENWKTYPSGVSHHSPTGDNQRWPEDYHLRDENH